MSNHVITPILQCYQLLTPFPTTNAATSNTTKTTRM